MKHLKEYQSEKLFLKESWVTNFLWSLLETPSDEVFSEFMGNQIENFKKENPNKWPELKIELQEQGLLDKDGQIIKQGIRRLFKGAKNL